MVFVPSGESRTVMEKTDPLHYIAAVVAGQDPTDGGLVIEGCSNVDELWPDLARLAIDQGMGPLLLRRLQELRIGQTDDKALAPLLSDRNQAAVHHMLAAQVQRQVEQAFRAMNVPCLWLKGIVLAQTVYPAPELRPMVDVDVLVPYNRREEALAIAESIGFELGQPLLFDGRDSLKHHYYLQSRTHRPVRLELHFRLLGPMDRLLTVEDQGWFWHHIVKLDITDAGEISALTPEAHLLYLCAHAMLQHGEYDMRLLRLYDLDRLIVRSQNFNWDLLINGAVKMRWTYAVERALALAQEYFSTPLPDGLLGELAARRPSTEDAEHVRRRQTQRTTSEVVMHDLAAMSWQDRMRAASRIIAPPPSYMRWRYGLANNRELPIAYLRRLGHISTDAVRSLRARAQRSQ